jgi:MraZ protein
MAIPSRYRERIQESCDGQLILTIDLDRCLLLYPLPEWEVIESKLAKLPALNKQARRLQRLLIGHATETEMDKAGRILLPPPLREYASIDKRVVMIGQGNKFEVWNEELWNERRQAWLDEEVDEEEGLPEEFGSLSL